MTPHQILEYIVAHKGDCPNDLRVCENCPLHAENASCIDTVFPNCDIPFEGINNAYYRAASSMLMHMLMEQALKDADHQNLAPSSTQ